MELEFKASFSYISLRLAYATWHPLSKSKANTKTKCFFKNFNYILHPWEDHVHTMLDSGNAVLNDWFAFMRECSSRQCFLFNLIPQLVLPEFFLSSSLTEALLISTLSMLLLGHFISLSGDRLPGLQKHSHLYTSTSFCLFGFGFLVFSPVAEKP